MHDGIWLWQNNNILRITLSLFSLLPFCHCLHPACNRRIIEMHENRVNADTFVLYCHFSCIQMAFRCFIEHMQFQHSNSINIKRYRYWCCSCMNIIIIIIIVLMLWYIIRFINGILSARVTHQMAWLLVASILGMWTTFKWFETVCDGVHSINDVCVCVYAH